MRIVTTSVEDFLVNLEAGTVWEGRIYYERSSRPLNGKTKKDATSFQIIYQLSAVMLIGGDEGGQALVVCGVDCGVDRLTEDGGKEGTEELNRLHAIVERWCEGTSDRGPVRLFPGILDQ